MQANKHIHASQPIAIVGAGELISHLYFDQENRENYRFNLFRLNNDCGRPTSWFEATDLKGLVKLCQVLAFTIADDGWISPEIRRDIRVIASELDVLTQKWSES